MKDFPVIDGVLTVLRQFLAEESQVVEAQSVVDEGPDGGLASPSTDDQFTGWPTPTAET